MSYHDLDHDELVEALRAAEEERNRLQAEIALLRKPPRLVWEGSSTDGFTGQVYYLWHSILYGWGWSHEDDRHHLCDSKEAAKAECQEHEDKMYAEMLEKPR